jgi:hypothetical protein
MVQMNQMFVTVTTSTLVLQPPSSPAIMHILSLPLALLFQLFLLWLLKLLDPLISYNLDPLSSSLSSSPLGMHQVSCMKFFVFWLTFNHLLRVLNVVKNRSLSFQKIVIFLIDSLIHNLDRGKIFPK